MPLPLLLRVLLGALMIWNKPSSHIETEGTYREPSEGLKVDVEGSGTGFIIDPAGITVTNNHVVAGASLLRVWISGETEARSAVVLGTSECSDLAVIDIDGDGFWNFGLVWSGN